MYFLQKKKKKKRKKDTVMTDTPGIKLASDPDDII